MQKKAINNISSFAFIDHFMNEKYTNVWLMDDS
jgi:hypothetical protein